MSRPHNDFYPDGINDPYNRPQVDLAKAKTLNPHASPDEVLHRAGDVVLLEFDYCDGCCIDCALVMLKDVTRRMIWDLSPPPVDNPRYRYLWVNDEIANVIDKAIELGWCERHEYQTSTIDVDHNGPWEFATTAALFK